MSEQNKIALLGGTFVSIYPLSSIYDPDVDGLNPATAQGKIVPERRSLIIDDTSSASVYSMWIVDRVDDRLKTHLVRPTLVDGSSGNSNRLFNYGNDTITTYFHKDYKGKVTVTMDDKLLIYGSKVAFYQLVKNVNGVPTPISRRIESADTENGSLVPFLRSDRMYFDVLKTFMKTKVWNEFSSISSQLNTNEWEFNFSFMLRSPMGGNVRYEVIPTTDTISAYLGMYAFDPTTETTTLITEANKANYIGKLTMVTKLTSQLVILDSPGRCPFSIGYDQVTEKLTLSINRGTNKASFVATLARDNKAEQNVKFRYVAGSLEIVYNGATVLSERKESTYTTLWTSKYAAMITCGDVSVTAVQVTDLTRGRKVWQVPYSTIWQTDYMSSPEIMIPQKCRIVEDVNVYSGETVQVEIYEEMIDSTGETVITLSSTFDSPMETAVIIDALNVSTKAIVEFDVELNGKPNQNPVWQMVQGTSIANMAFTPRITFADGTVEYVQIDNLCCFAYGLTEVSSANIGMEYEVLFKYFPAKHLLSPNVYRTASGFLVCSKKIRIVPEVQSSISKISVIPVWNKTARGYGFAYYAYAKDNSPAMLIQNSNIEFTSGTLQSQLGTRQNATFRTKITQTDGTIGYYSQQVSLKLEDYDGVKEPWLIASKETDTLVYGSNSTPYKRPILKVNTLSRKCSVSATDFPTKDKFLENFYYRAQPPMATTVPQVPTHFRVKTLNDNTPVTAHMPISSFESDGSGNLVEVKNYLSPFSLAVAESVVLIGMTVVVEFSFQSNDTFYPLYGVPVEIRPE